MRINQWPFMNGSDQTCRDHHIPATEFWLKSVAGFKSYMGEALQSRKSFAELNANN